MDCSFSKDVVLQLRRCVQTNFHNARTRVIQLYAHTIAVIRLHLSKKKYCLRSCTEF